MHAVLLPRLAADRMLDRLAAALDGSGPAVLPLDADLPASRLRDLVDAFAPAVVETVDGVTPVPSATSRANPGVAGPVAVVVATSGSTGTPKGVELSAAALLASARASLARVGARSGERWLCCLPVTHIAGIQVLVRSLESGTRPAVVDRPDEAALLASGCAHVSLVPTQLRRLLGTAPAGSFRPPPVSDASPPKAVAASAFGSAGPPTGDTALAGFGSVLLGGAAAPAALVDAARAAGVPVVTTYGMSETCGGCVYDGVPLDGVSADTNGDGVIRIAGQVLFSGYRLRPEETAAALDGGWFRTSDVGRVDDSGRLTVRGRVDDVITTGGEKVVAAEVVATLEANPTVAEAAVVGRPDPDWGERVTAVVVPARADHPPTLELLREHVRRSLPRYAAPRELVLVDALPLLPSGKPDLESLRREQNSVNNVTT